MAPARSPAAARDAAASRGSRNAWHARSVDEVSEALQLDIARGLTTADAAARLARDGANVLPEAARRSVLVMLLHQFKSLIVLLLLVAGAVALAMGDVQEAVAILVVIALNAAIGLVTEWKAANAIASLRQQVVTVAQVRRDGTEQRVRAETLVVGDVVILAAGDRVPADGRVVEQARLQVDESALTGESLPVAKSTDVVADEGAPLGDRTSMVHLGTAVTDGRGVFVVTATGVATEMGAIGTMLDDLSTKRAPLEGKLQQLSRALLVVVLALCVIIVLIGWIRGHPLLFMVEVGISLAIAAVPEGLLAVTTMTLAVGMQRMARMHALIRRLPAVESLGSTTVICTDKTGTLTRNEMTVRVIVAAAGRVNVTGVGYASDGHLVVDGDAPTTDAPDESVRLALRIGALCNDASLRLAETPPVVLGDPTEAALIVAAAKAGMDHATLEREYPRLREIPFESRSKRMVTVHRTPEGRVVAYAKGAPSALLDASRWVMDVSGVVAMTPERRERIVATNDALAGEAMRVLAFAYRDLPAQYNDDDLTRDLTFVGVVGMMDPLRDEAKTTIERCRLAGIRAVMITGDQQVTASAIARQLGLDVSADGRALRTLHERDLAGLDADGWRDAVTGTAVFARVSPHHKLQIVEALQRHGEVVAMTGDGVNDAPALRKADVGVAMGIRGTEVAKESADMIITDDNFATIVGAVEQGRVIVENILRFIHYLFSCNFAEILTVFASIMVGWPLPIGVLQILWLNLVTDIFPAMALALEPSAPDVMRRPPRDPSSPLMTPRFGWLIVWQGSVLAASTLAAFGVGLRWYGSEGDGLHHAVTIAFMTLALAQVAHVFNARSTTRSALAPGVRANRWLWGATAICLVLQLATVGVPLLRGVLRTTPLTPLDWGVVLAAAVAPVVVVEAVKLAQRARALTHA